MFHAELPRLFLFLLVLSIAVPAQNFAESHSKIRDAVENKDYQIAVAELQNLKRIDKKIFDLNNYDYLLARMAEKQGDFAVATENYQAVAARKSILSEYAAWHLSRIFRSTGNLFLERVYLQKLLTFPRESLLTGAANKRLARSHFESGDYSAVINLLSAAGSLKTNALSQADGQRTASENPSRENLVLLGQSYLQSGKTGEAAEVFTRLIVDLPNPAQPDDFALAGARSLDEIAAGKDNFGKLVPPLTDAEHFRRASIYQFNRNFAPARLHYRAIVEKHPGSEYIADALYQIGRGLAQERNFNEAANWYERVQAEFPDQLIARDALSQAAAAYSRVNKPKESLSRYQKFIEKYPDAENLDRAYLNMIDVLRDTGANSEALKWTAKAREVFRGRLPEALALFSQARIHLSQNNWTNALEDLTALQNLPDLGGTRAAGGTNKSEILFLKGFALENLDRFPEAIDVYLSIPDGRGEYYGWRATERLKALARDENAQNFTTQKMGALIVNIESQNAEAQRKSAQAVLRLTENANVRPKMLEITRRAYAALPDYRKIPGGQLLALGRKEVLREQRDNPAKNHHENLADELLFLGLYDEGAPELEKSQKAETANQKDATPAKTVEGKSKQENRADFNYTLAVFYNRGDMANRAVTFIEPLWKNVPADYEIELIPRQQLELLYPTPYSYELLQHAAPRKIDPRLVLSIMRQESRFRPDVKSNAAARGLMQFISTTSAKIAIELKKENFKQDDLYEPATAILFGSQYLSNLFVMFPNQPAAVAASYNGGEDNMMRWLARAKSDDPDRYVPEIVFSQSKDYVYKVMASYRVYRMYYDENLKNK